MLTNPTYLDYAGQIAALFCDSKLNKTLCISAVKQRIINAFTNETFAQSVLPNLDRNKFHSFELVKVEDYGTTYKVTIRGFDILTGKNTGDIGIQGVSMHWTDRDVNKMNWQEILKLVPWRFIGIQDGRIIARMVTDNYGIIFVLETIEPVNGGGNGNGASNCPPGFIFFGGRCVKTTGSVVPKPPPIVPKPGEPEKGIIFNLEMLVIPALIAGTVFYLSQTK